MVSLNKRISSIDKKIEHKKLYSLSEALSLIKETAIAKFNESIDTAVQLGIDPKKSDQLVRGSVVLPSGTGKIVRIAVFAQGEKAILAKEAGADIVGFDDLAEIIKSGKIEFDAVIASPDAMRIVGGLGQILGPRGLMPNPKVGTLTQDVVLAIKNLKMGQIQYRTDKAGIIHASIGRSSFTEEQLKSNLMTLIDALQKSRPLSSKGLYLKKINISSTMGRGIRVNISSLAFS
ncbi:MAG: 50S ribosomal protein L1 [Bordetella sp.]|nr:MAG: 50S ribosomal protein L1 [Bordetella sp.]